MNNISLLGFRLATPLQQYTAKWVKTCTNEDILFFKQEKASFWTPRFLAIHHSEPLGHHRLLLHYCSTARWLFLSPLWLFLAWLPLLVQLCHPLMYFPQNIQSDLYRNKIYTGNLFALNPPMASHGVPNKVSSPWPVTQHQLFWPTCSPAPSGKWEAMNHLFPLGLCLYLSDSEHCLSKNLLDGLSPQVVCPFTMHSGTLLSYQKLRMFKSLS
jgi:hypothetical protein